MTEALREGLRLWHQGLYEQALYFLEDIDVLQEPEAAYYQALSYSRLGRALEALEAKLTKTRAIADIETKAPAFRKEVFAGMVEVRKAVDALERVLPADFYPYPTYEDLLFRF